MIATGLPASPGAAVGQVVFTAEDAEAWHAQGKPTILVQNADVIGFASFCIGLYLDLRHLSHF